VELAPAHPAGVRHRNNVIVSGRDGARPMVFAHGFGCSQEAWRLVAPRFEADHRVIRFDHVGSGGSDLAAYDPVKYDSLHGYADDVLEIVDELDLHDVVFVGHSVGAMIGVLAANRDPSRFGALVLVGPSPRYVDDEGYRGGFSADDITSLLDSLDANYLGWSAEMAPAIMGNPDRPELGDELTELFCRVDPAVARQFAHVTFLSDNRRDLAAVSLPTLVLQSGDDLIAPTAVGEYVHEQIRGSVYRQLPSTGHIPNLSGPDALVGAIRGFLG
jgi:sigma-B regulation protein RsbQ